MSTLDLFGAHKKRGARVEGDKNVPLAERMRPKTLKEMVGQGHMLAKDDMLYGAIERDEVPSLILWGPPGCGKTTLANIIAHETQASFVKMSAVLSGVPELRKVVAVAEQHKKRGGKRTILFIDEIHRFHKGQQDALLPHVEGGTITLIGATTENPSFALTNALLSRTHVLALEALTEEEIAQVLSRAVEDKELGVGGYGLTYVTEALAALARYGRGDARRALGLLEATAKYAIQHKRERIDVSVIEAVVSDDVLLYDKSGEEHYNVVSALIKSMRGSDPDAAVYWMMRMLEGGDDPRFILRRMIIFASEDIGNADPGALSIAVAADRAFERIGMPEGIYVLAHCCVYLASAPKSNACYKAFVAAKEDIKKYGSLPVPLKLRNAATAAMKSWGYGSGYRYPHNEGGYAEGETYLPDLLKGRKYYAPTSAGAEAGIKTHLERLSNGKKEVIEKDKA